MRGESHEAEPSNPAGQSGAGFLPFPLHSESKGGEKSPHKQPGGLNTVFEPGGYEWVRFRATLSLMTGRFRYYLRVRYAECDAQRVVFNARYADYVDLATTEFVRALGFGAALLDGSLDYQLVKLTIEWKAPARYDQVLELSVCATRLGNTSFTISTEIRVAGEEPVIVTAETVNVAVNTSTLQKMPLPPDFRAGLEKGAPGVITDHAGLAAVK